MSVEPESRDEPTRRILTTVAEREGVEPIELEPPLFDVIDGDMLNTLVSSNELTDDPSLEISFSYNDYDIYVNAAGDVEVTATE